MSWIDKALEFEYITPSLKKKAESRIPKLESDAEKYRKLLEKPVKKQ